MITDEELQEMEARCNAATPGPWYDSRPTKSIRVTHESPAFNRGSFNIAKYPTRTNESLLSHEEWEGNATFIAAARTDVLRLIKEVKRLGSLYYES